MRKLNWKFLLVLLTALFVVGAGVHMLWAVNVGGSTNVVLKKAQAARAEGELGLALKHYHEYLNRTPDDAEATCEAALTAVEISKKPNPSYHATLRNIRQAYQWLERALRKSPARNDVRRELVDLLVNVRSFNEAATNIVALEKNGESSVELDLLFAKCSVMAGEDTAALRRLEELTGFDTSTGDFKRGSAPGEVEAYTLLANILQIREDDHRYADKVIDQMVATNSASPQALLARARYLLRYNKVGDERARESRKQRAHVDIRRAYDLDRKDVEVLLENANLALDEEEYESAERFLDVLLKEHPDNSRAYITKARVAQKQQDFKRAVAIFNDGLEKIKDDRQLIRLLHDAQLQIRDVDGAMETIKKMEELEFAREDIALARAKIPLVENNWSDAASQLETLRPQVSQNPGMSLIVDSLLGQCYERLNQPDRQLQAFNRVLSLEGQAKNLGAMRGQVGALAKLNRYEEAYAVLRKIRGEMGDQDYTADQQLLQQELLVLDFLGRKTSLSIPEQKRLAAIKQRIGTSTAADGPQGGGNTSVQQVIFQVDELSRANKHAEAKRLAVSALRKNPQDPRLQRLLLNLVVMADGPKDALRLLDRAQKDPNLKWPDSIHYRLVKVDLLSRLRDPEDVKLLKGRLVQLENNIDQFPPDAQAKLLKGLGQAYMSVVPPDVAEARRCWDRASELNPDDQQILDMLFTLALDTDDEVGVLAVMSEIEKRYGADSIQWKYARAKRLVAMVQRGGAEPAALDEASTLAAEIANERPDWQLLLQLQGEVHDLRGNQERAIELYQKSLKGSPSPGTVRRLVELLMKNNRHAEAREAMKLIGRTPQGMHRHKIWLNLQQGGDEKEVLAALAQEVPEQSTNPRDLMWRGWVLRQLRRMDAAEAAFRRAVDYGPGMPETWLVLIEHLAGLNQRDEAERVIRRARNQLPEELALSMLARAYTVVGISHQAEHYFRAAVQARPDDAALVRDFAKHYLRTNQGGKAIRYLASILEKLPDNAQNQADANWLRRTLASILGTAGDHATFAKALGLLEANRRDGQLSVEDERAMARMLSTRPEPAYRAEALDLLEQVKLVKPLLVAEQLMMARLYEQNDRWTDALSLMHELRLRNPSDPSVLTTFCEMLLDHGEADQAGDVLKALAKVNAKSPETIRLVARYLVAKGRDQEAVAQLEQVLQTKQPSAADASKLLWVARVQEELELYEAAEKNFRRLLAMQPNSSLAVAAYFARRGDLDAAFSLCNSALSEKTVHAVCGIGVTALSEHPDIATTRHKSQLLQWMKYLTDNAPEGYAKQMQQASILEATGKEEQAEKIWVSLLDKDITTDQRIVIGNNLAYMQAMSGRADASTLGYIDKSIELAGPRPQLLDTRAMVHVALGADEKAIGDVQEATSFGDGSGPYFFHFALAHQSGGDKSQARKALTRAAEDGFLPEKLLPRDRKKYDALINWIDSRD